MGRLKILVLLTVVALAAGCEEETRECTAGVEVICTCPGGNGKGTKICQALGVWGACEGCGATDGGPDGKATDGPAGEGKSTDGIVADTFVGETAPDASPGDTGPKDVTITDAPVGPSPWLKVPMMTKTSTLYAVWGSGPTDVYVVGGNGTVGHFNGRKPATQSWFKDMTSGTITYHGLWGTGPKDVFAVGESGIIRRFDGEMFKAQTSGTTSSFRTIWGTGFTGVYALGEFGTALVNGRTTSPNTWAAVKPGSKATFLGAWGSSSKSFIVVGSGGTILRFDGAWKTMSSGTTNHLWGVWTSAAGKAYAVGEKGVILRYDGAAWKAMTSGTVDTLFGVWGTADNNIYAVGDNGVILRYDGTSWKKMNSGTKNGLRAVWGSSGSSVWVVGESMTVLHLGTCDCKVGNLCYAANERDGNGCSACLPSTSTTSLTPLSAACTINTVCYAQGEKDSTGCKTCDQLKSKTAWSTVSGVCTIGGQCWANGQLGVTHCQQCVPTKSSNSWSAVSGKCQISGMCLASGTKDSTGCKVCDPTKSGTAWTVVPNKCNIGGTCYTNGAKDSSGCRVCNPTKNPTGWTEISGKCFILGKCYNNGVKDSNACRVCDTTKNTKAWTVTSGNCFIDSKCHPNGTKPTGSTCRSCNTAVSSTTWTLAGSTCFIGGKCYVNGNGDSTGCRKCDVSKATTAWTMLPKKCLIGTQCVAGGVKDVTGCQVCDPAKSTSNWTMLGCPSTLPKHKVTFAHGTSTSSMTLATIMSDGTGYQKVPGFGTLYMSYSSYLYGRVRQYYPFTRSVPQQLQNQPYYPIGLPNGLGTVRYFRDYVSGQYQVGALHVAPDGDVTELYRTPGSSTSNFYYYFSVSDDGKWVASHSATAKRVVLMRTDGKKFTSGQSFVELTMSPTPYYIYPTSITLTNKWLYVITRQTSSYASKHTLWRAPADGSAGLKPVNLPMVNGVVPTWIDDEIAFSDDGKTAIVTAGNYYSSSYSNSEDVISVDDAGKAVNITKSPYNYEERGYQWGYYSNGCQLAVSPTGKYVGYVRYVSSTNMDLYVAKADGTGAKLHVTSPTNYSTSYKRVFNLKWVDDDNLIFSMYGSSSSYNDLFRFQVSTQTVTNVTKNTKATKPFTLSGGYMLFYGMWLSPNKKWLYYLNYKQASPYYTRDIVGVDLTTWKTKNITTGAEVYTSADSFAACDKKPIMFFAAEPKAINYTQLQLFMFDMNTGGPATQLTNIKKSPSSSTYWYVYDIQPSADCGAVAFRSGYSSYYDAWAVRLKPTPVASNITEHTTAKGYNYIWDQMGISGDNSQVIYFSGTASNKYTMNRALTLGKCCAPKTIYTGTGTYKYWYLFGVK